MQPESSGLPLIGQKGRPNLVVEKDDMIRHAQKFGDLMVDRLNDAKDLCDENDWSLCSPHRRQAYGKSRSAL